MTDRPAETYDEWLERTTPGPTRRVAWESWVGIGAGLFIIFALNAVLIGCIVVGTSASSVVRVLVGPVTSSERVKRRISVAWTGVWALGAAVALIREQARGWAWWVLLASTVAMVLLELRPLLRRVVDGDS